MTKTWRGALGLALMGLVLWGCNGGDGGTGEKKGSETPDGGQKKAGEAKAEDTRIVVYAARSKKLVDPLIKKFEASSGVKVDVRYGDATNLVTKIRTEGAQSDADVFLAQDVGHLGVLRDSKLLKTLPDEVINQTIESFREKSKTWVAVSGRVRVLVYNPDKVKPEELPESLKGLTDARWKGRMGWAPRNGSFLVHVSGLRAIWGEEATEKWLTEMAANEPAVYPKNSPQVNACDKGEIDVGWVNHYYLHSLRKANPALKAANHHFSAEGDAGNLMMLSGVAVLSASKKSAAAEKFAAWLVSEEAQGHFAREVFEYPTRSGVKTHKDIPALDTLKLAPVDQSALTDIGPTLKLLQKLKLH